MGLCNTENIWTVDNCMQKGWFSEETMKLNEKKKKIIDLRTNSLFAFSCFSSKGRGIRPYIMCLHTSDALCGVVCDSNLSLTVY